MDTSSTKKGPCPELSLAKQPTTRLSPNENFKRAELDTPFSQAPTLPKTGSCPASPFASPCDSFFDSPSDSPWGSPHVTQQGLLIIGTGTDIGKTLVTAALLRALGGSGIMPHGLKVIQTGCLQDSNGQLLAPDVQRYTEACPQGNHRVLWCFEPACSPHLAARQNKTSFSAIQVAQSVQSEITTLPPHAFMCVEGSGGVMVPINEQETFLDVFGLLRLPALMVCPNELGCVNHALLTAHALSAKSIPLLGFVLTSPQKTQGTNSTHTKGKNIRSESNKAEAHDPEVQRPETSTPETRTSATITSKSTSLTDTSHAIRKDNRVILETMLDAPCLGEIPWLSSFASSGGRASNHDWDKAASALAPVVQALKKPSLIEASSGVCNTPNK